MTRITGDMTPVNRVAGRVVSTGTHYAPQLKSKILHWDQFPGTAVYVGDHANNMTGAKCGRLTVVGFWGFSWGKNSKGLWLVRCCCGRYEVRRTRAIRNAANRDDCCCVCKHRKHLQRNDEFRRLGFNRDEVAP